MPHYAVSNAQRFLTVRAPSCSAGDVDSFVFPPGRWIAARYIASMLHTCTYILRRIFIAPCSTIIDMLFLIVRRSLSANIHSAIYHGRTQRSPLTYGVPSTSRGRLGIIEMLRSRLVALLRSSELHPCSFSNVCDHRKEDSKPFDVCRSDDKCIVTDEHDEHGLRKVAF